MIERKGGAVSTILITGFEPFTTGQGLKLAHNPTAEWAEAISARVDDADFAVLPVSYRRTKQTLNSLFSMHKPSIWLGLGYAPHRLNIDVEHVALNLEDCSGADNDNESPTRRPIVVDGPLALRTRLDTDRAVSELRKAGLVANHAFHAGTFLCNQSFYLGCYQVEVLKRLDKAGFIHVPPQSDGAGFVEAIASFLRLEAGCPNG